MKVISIAAIAENNGIGKNNRLLFRLPEDIRFFKETTMGYPVITGRKNYESIPEKFRPLPGRKNLIISRQNDYSATGAEVYSSMNEALDALNNEEAVYVIGGGQVYDSAHDNNLLDELLISHVKGAPEADVFYPEIDEGLWKGELIKKQPKDERHEYAFEIVRYTRRT